MNTSDPPFNPTTGTTTTSKITTATTEITTTTTKITTTTTDNGDYNLRLLKLGKSVFKNNDTYEN